MKRNNYSTGAHWESIVGYSRAVRIGNVIEVSGTCSVNEAGEPFAPGDMYQQARRALEIITKAVESLGAHKEDIVRTRMYVTDISQWEDAGKAHGEVFGHIQPATTMVEVSKLINPVFLIEIEATAIVAE